MIGASAAPAAKHHQHHTKGCWTHACDVRVGRKWAIAHPPPKPAMQTALASWYDDSEQTASGTHASLGFAHLGPGEGAYAGMAMGTEVEFCAARCAVGTMDDHGPYVSGREFDLGPALKSAIGCSDLCELRWRRK